MPKHHFINFSLAKTCKRLPTVSHGRYDAGVVTETYNIGDTAQLICDENYAPAQTEPIVCRLSPSGKPEWVTPSSCKGG